MLAEFPSGEFLPLVRSLRTVGSDYSVCPEWLSKKAVEAGFPAVPEEVITEGLYYSFDPYALPIQLGNSMFHNTTVFIFRKYRESSEDK